MLSAAALVGLAASLLSTPVAAFVTTLGDRTRWDAPPSWGVGRATADLPAAALVAALERSAAQWRGVDGVEIPLPRDDAAPDIRIDFLDPWPPELGPAVTGNTITTTEGGAFVAAEVQLNDVALTFTDQADPVPSGLTYLPGVLTHELGHALGLAHSPRRAATMYWHYQGPEGATLDEDDARGLRFLYGDAPPGQPCDTCLVTDDCADGGWCLAVAPGQACCGRGCGVGCPGGFDCVPLQNGAESCWPRAGSCDDRGVGLRGRGETCWGAAHCAWPLRCAVLPGGALCAVDCGADADCAPGERCLLGWGGGTACAPRGPGATGEGCTTDLDCTDGLCLGDAGARRCRTTCGVDADCPGDAVCRGLGSPTGTWGGCVTSAAGDAGTG